MVKYDYEAKMRATVPNVDIFMQKTFSNVVITVKNAEKLEIAKKSTSLFTCTHRSHCDYFLLGELLWGRFGFSNIRFAAGDNLTNLPILGKMFLHWGAYPVSRDRANERNYILELCNLSVDMLVKNQNILVFPEGGRSYTGEMLEIRQVLLGAGVLAQSRNADKDFYYIPAAISYEQLPELLYFKTLRKGRNLRKNKKNILDAIYANVLYFGADIIAFAKFFFANRFKKNYGAVYVDIGEPILIRESADLPGLFNPSAPNEFFGHRSALKQISARLTQEFLALYRVLPHHVVAYLLQKYSCTTVDDCLEKAVGIIEKIQSAGLNSATIKTFEIKPLVLEGLRLLAIMQGATCTFDQIKVKNPAIVSYYAQTLLPHIKDS